MRTLEQWAADIAALLAADKSNDWSAELIEYAEITGKQP